jgi:predicted acyl esterase
LRVLICVLLTAGAAVNWSWSGGASAETGRGPIVFRPKGLSTDRFPVADSPEWVTIKAHDGTDLFSWVYRPDIRKDPRWRSPAILVYSPYFTRKPNPSVYTELIRYFTPKGYAVVLSHVRGTGRSGGCLEQDGINQQKDFGTVVEYLAGQKWSNGKVGSYGLSYDGETQNAGAVHHPKGLATIVPAAAVSNLYDTVYFDGVPLYVLNQTVASSYAVATFTPTNNTHFSERPWCQPEQITRNADPSGDMTPYFVERDFRRRVRELRASVLYVQGLKDTNVLPINIDGFYDRIPTFKRAIFGQWTHEFPDTNATGHGRKDWLDILHAWYDHELLGLATGVEGWPAVQVQDESNVWRAARSFADLGEETTQPLGQGVIGQAGRPGATVSFQEPWRAEWVGSTVQRPLHLSGQVFMDTTITLDRPDAHFVLLVEEVRPNGRTRILTVGYLSAPHRDSLTDPAPVAPGSAERYHIRTYPFDATVAPGSRLRVSLSGIQVESTEAGFNMGLPALNLYTAIVAVDGKTTLTLPVVRNVCGIDVRQMRPPKGPVPGCP